MKEFLAAIVRLRAFEALRYREYRLLSYGQLFGNLGTWMDEVTRGWLIYQLTDSAAQLGLVRGIQLIPLLLLLPLAGSAADRYSRKALLIIAQIVMGTVFAATALLIFTDLIRPWHVYVTAILVGSMQVFQLPTRAAMVSDTVPSEYLTNAMGLNAVLFNMARIVGPALAGALIAASGTGSAFSVQAACLFLATAWTVQMRLPQRHSDGAHKPHRESFGRSIIEGWKFSWRSEPVRAGIMCTMIVSLFIYPFTTLLPVFARDLLGVGARGQGFLLTAMGIGALISAGLIASAGHRMTRGVVMLGSSILYGFVVVIFAASPWFALSLAVMAVAGLCHVNANGLVSTVVQSYSPAEFRGRAMAMFNMNQVFATAGSMLIGALSVSLGPRWAVTVMGVAGSLAIITMYVALPHARHVK